MSTITLPTIHLNGSNAETLMAAYLAAITGLHAAQEALAAVPVHGRDYYVQGPDVVTAALDEHRNRAGLLAVVSDELEAIYAHIADQQETRRTR